MKCKDNDLAPGARARARLVHPAVLVAIVVSAALTLTCLISSPVRAFADSTPTETSTTGPTPSTTASPAPTATTTAAPSPVSTATPSTTSTTTPATTPGIFTGETPSPAPVPSAQSVSVVVPGSVVVPVDHHVLARIEGAGFLARYLPVDAPMTDAAQFQTIRLRFKLHNASAVEIKAAPQLEYRTDGSSGYLVVPEQPVKGVPFHIVREWVPSLGLAGGTMQGPLGEDIAVASLRTGNEGGGLAVKGHHSMGANPDRAITMPPVSYTEQEFSIRLTKDARYRTGYTLRITDGVSVLAGTQVARIHLGPAPVLRLSPGQQQGVQVGGPKHKSRQRSSTPAGSSSAGSAFPAAFLASDVSTSDFSASEVSAASSSSQSATTRYPLVASTLSAATVAASDIHGPYSMNADQCAVCHRGHQAQAPNLLVKGSQSTLCLTCHDGLGANSNVQAQYALARPVNNPAAREYYSHDALAPSTHTRSELDEFGGVSNRHSECADCHNSHKAGSANTAQTATGWDASGRLAGVSGVSVVNGEAGTAPSYAFLDGTNKPLTREYQLCFKCHSGSTTLTSNTGLKPSQYALDKGVELNPNNPSFHPVEAAGTNRTTKMAENLAGSSPYKLWNFTPESTIRCLNCHASGSTPDATGTPPPAADGTLQPHTSGNRGILLRNYRDRVLTSSAAAYSAGDFALCYVCHGEEPYANNTANATNFPLHGKHLTGLAGKGSGGTDIDTPGDGQGNAICAECHFRLHSTTNKVGTQAVPGTRLVNFAPNVQPSGGVISWTPGATTGSGSCTLTCHGYTHDGDGY